MTGADESALTSLKEVVDVLLRLRGDDATARLVAEDPDWHMPERTRRHVAMLWSDLQQLVTAEIGTALTRQVTDWTGEFEPRIVVGEPSDFDPDPRVDAPYGWLPLGRLHRREAGWDFSPNEASGTWIGWWEPEQAFVSEGGEAHVQGVLTGFIIVTDEGVLEFAHVVRRRRRTGIATSLVRYGAAHHGLTAVSPIQSDDGRGLAAALRRDGLLP